MDIFQSLLDIDKALVNWIVGTSADTDAERQQMVQALAAKSEIDEAINTLVAYRLKLASSALAQDAKDLDAIAKGMAKVDEDIAKVQSILDYAGQAVSLASGVIQKVVAV